MTELTTVEPKLPDLAVMSTQDLRAELGRALNVSAQHLLYLAAVWQELQRRGEDLSELRVGLSQWLPQIAAGRVDANTVIRFAGSPTLLRAIAELPVPQQRAFADGEPVQVLTLDPTGQYRVAELPARDLTATQARIVFGAGSVRSVDQQRALLDADRLARQRRQPSLATASKVRADTRTGTIVVGRTRVTVGELMAAVAAIYADRVGPIPEEGGGRSLVIQLTEEEHRAIKVRAAEGGATLQGLVRGGLGSLGLLG